MRLSLGRMRGAFASAALAFASVVAAWAATPIASGWTADPDEQFLLDVNIRQLRLGDGVRAYQTPEGTCVILGDFLTTLDVPMKIDLQSRKASGWAFRESNRIEIDQAAMVASHDGKQEKIAENTIRETPEGWCVETGALGRWFGLGVKASTAGSLLMLESEAKLPVEMAIEREKRAARLHKAALPTTGIPEVKLPYRMWRAPALDFIVSAGATYSAKTGLKVDRRLSVQAAGEIARLSYDALVTTNNHGVPQSVRFRAYRSNPEGGLLGPFDATHFAIGDVAGVSTRLLPGNTGRGVEVTNRPLFNPVAFDRTRFEGDLPPGWDAEIYRNGELLSFTSSDGSGRYLFDDVPLTYGDNRFEIILYGPQGQTKTRVETLNVGDEQVPKGKTWYSASISQPGRSLVGDIVGPSDAGRPPGPRALDDYRTPELQAAVRADHGVGQRTSIGVLAAMLLAGDQKLTFVEGSVRHSLGGVVAEFGAARDNRGGVALRAQALGQIGRLNVNVDALLANDFVVNGRREAQYRDVRIGVDAPLKIGRTPMALHGDVHYQERSRTDRQLIAEGRMSANFNGFNLSTLASWQHRLDNGGSGGQPDRFDVALIGTGRIKRVRIRGEADWEVMPENRLRSLDLSAYWSASDRADWEGAVGYDAFAKRGTVRLSHIHRFKALAAAASVEAGTDGRFAVGVNLNFSLGQGEDGYRFTNQRLASTGSIEARVYRDLNDNGTRDPTEPYEEGAFITTGPRVSEHATGKNGLVRVDGLTPNQPVAVGIDTSSLNDPSFAPKEALQMVVPRAGIAARIEIPLVGAGDIEGILVKDDGRGFEGLDVELVDAGGRVIASTRSDYDGFILFERVPFGRYTMRLTADSARAAHVMPAIPAGAAVDADHSVARLGAIRVSRQPQVALASPEPAAAN